MVVPILELLKHLIRLKLMFSKNVGSDLGIAETSEHGCLASLLSLLLLIDHRKCQG